MIRRRARIVRACVCARASVFTRACVRSRVCAFSRAFRHIDVVVCDQRRPNGAVRGRETETGPAVARDRNQETESGKSP